MTNLIVFFLLIQVIHFLGTWKLYKKAGRASWEAAVPIYNAYILTKIINRPWWWVILLFIPIINLLMFPAFWVETARSYGKEKTSELFLTVFSLGFYIYYLNYLTDVNYQSDRQLKPYTKAGEWTTSIVFAIVAATLVHTYFMRPYTIPTSSLEKSLLVGDYLFVSKFHYGARTPKTALSLPMVHDTMPIPYTGIRFKSYIKEVQLPNFRFPGFQKIKRNDIVVFNWPTDTVRFFRDHSSFHADKPLDKKSNYVKRCVGIPGDSLELRNGYVFINGKQTVLPDRAKTQYNYTVETKEYPTYNIINNLGLVKEYNCRFIKSSVAVFGEMLKNKDFKNRLKDYKIKDSIVEFETYYNFNSGQFKKLNLTATKKATFNLTQEKADKLRKDKRVVSVTQQSKPKGSFNKAIFPHDAQYPWTRDNFGPIYIPKKGDKVALTKQSIPFYKRIIKEYEGNDLTIDGETYYINSEVADSYTFKQNYYWMMGDNRHNSEDARYWGYVPFDHVVGKPVFIWFSIEQFDPNNPKSFFKRIRTERLFTTVHYSGEPKSYLVHFLVVIALLWGFSFIRNRKKSNS